MGTSKKSRVTVTSTNQQLETAIVQYYPKGAFTLGGETWKTADIVAALNKENQLIAAANNAHGAWLAAASAAREQTTQNNELRSDLRTALVLLLGKTKTAELADFGITVRAPKPRTGVTNVSAAQKAAATRAARGTVGSKARLRIHAVVATQPAPTAQPVAPTSVPAVAANPAPGTTTK
jgi:hypothetical protein